MTLYGAAGYTIGLSWVFFGASFLVIQAGVRRRRAETAVQRERSLRAPASMLGAALEVVAGLLAFAVRGPEPGATACLTAMVMAPASALFAAAAFRELGLQLRIKAVVTENHKLVQSGPYALVRHPIYLTVLGLIASSGLVFARPAALAAAIVVCLIGTEIRIRAEEGILARRFGPEFEEYRRCVPAYLPFVR